MSTLRLDQHLVIIIICILLLLPIHSVKKEATPQLPSLVTLAPLPILNQQSMPGDEFMATVSAKSALAIDIPSAALLLSKNSDEQVPPASTTKMLTALVAREQYGLEDIVTIEEAAFSVGTTTKFLVDEQLSVRSLLASLLVNSGNDAALALANHHPQGYDGFVTAMNRKAAQLHLSHSAFRNPSGLDEADHYSTAKDLGIVARALMVDSELRKIVSTKEMVIADVTGEHVHYLYNTNTLLHQEPGVFGIKTGTTELAKENVITFVDRDEHQLLFVVLGSEDRYGDTRKMLHWVEQNYRWVTPDTSVLQLVQPQ